MKETFQKIKTHISTHKELYITCAVTAVVTAGITLLIVNHSRINSQVTQKAIASWKPVLEQNTNVVIQAPGNSGNVLQDDLGNLFVSQNAAAKALKVDPKAIHEHLKGRISNINGRVLTKVLDGSPLHALAA